MRRNGTHNRYFSRTLTAALLALTAGPASAIMVNIAPDGSSLDIAAPWVITGARLCPPKSLALHAFRQDRIEANVCLLTETKDTAKDFIDDLWASYEKNLIGRKVPSPAESDKLKGGIAIHHFTFNTPPGFILKESACVMDAFFKRGELMYMYVVAKPQATAVSKPMTPVERTALNAEVTAFERTAKEGFRLIENVKWPPAKAKRR